MTRKPSEEEVRAVSMKAREVAHAARRFGTELLGLAEAIEEVLDGPRPLICERCGGTKRGGKADGQAPWCDCGPIRTGRLI